MFEYLFEAIPRLLFEPIAVASVLGITTALFRFRKKRGAFFYVVLTAISFFLIWRLVLHEIMISSRYASVLILPALIFSTWFGFQLAPIVRWIMKSRVFASLPHKRIICRTLPYLWVTGLTIACLVKTLHYNPYSDHLYTICQAFLAASEGQSPVYLHASGSLECSRIAYYCGRHASTDVIPFRSDDQTNATLSEIQERANLTINIPGVHYFFILQKAGAPVLTAKDLNLPGDADNWKEIKRVYTSRRKNREMVLYSFTAPCLNIEETEGPVPPPRSGNLCLNGDFERALSPESLKNRVEYYQENQIPDYKDEKYLLPDCWWPTLQKDDPPAIFLDDRNPIAGKYSLFYNVRNAGSPSKINVLFFPIVRGTYSMYVRAEEGENVNFAVTLLCKNSKSGAFLPPEALLFKIPAGKTCHIHGILPEIDKSLADVMTIFLEVRSGALSLDQVEVIQEDIRKD